MNINRFKNYGLWVSVAALGPVVLQSFGIKVVSEQYSEIVNAVLSILVVAGILSDPTTDNKGYLDDNK